MNGADRRVNLPPRFRAADALERVVSGVVWALLVFSAVIWQPPGAAVAQELEDVEEPRGTFTLSGQDFTVVLHFKRLPGADGPDARALASLEIRDTAGEAQHRQSFPHTVEDGFFTEACSADARLLEGSSGADLLIESGRWPSAPLGGGPWQIVGVVGGRLAPIGDIRAHVQRIQRARRAPEARGGQAGLPG